MSDRAAVRIVRAGGWGPELPFILGDGVFRPIVWPGANDWKRSLHYIELSPSSSTTPLSHPSEAVYYVVAGTGIVSGGGGPERPIVEGSMVHVSPGTEYSFRTDTGLTLVGGPCPADITLYTSIGGAQWA